MDVATGEGKQAPEFGGHGVSTTGVEEDLGDRDLVLDDEVKLELVEALKVLLLHVAVADLDGRGGVVGELRSERRNDRVSLVTEDVGDGRIGHGRGTGKDAVSFASHAVVELVLEVLPNGGEIDTWGDVVLFEDATRVRDRDREGLTSVEHLRWVSNS